MSVLNGQFENLASGVQILNPFVHKLELDNPVDKIKTAVLTVLLLPLRVICICILLIAAWLLACIGLWGLSLDDLRSRPMTGWRRTIRALTSFTMRAMFFMGSFHYIKTIGRQASTREAPILAVAPHSSFFDSIVVILFGPPAAVAKAEAATLPFFGKLINYTQPIYVWRDDPNSRQNTIKSIIERANSKEDWPQIIIFPEGTCTNRSCLITFKPGAFYPGVPVQPVCIRYPNKLDTVTWTWEGPGVLKLLWLTLTQFHSSCEIEFLPVYIPNDDEKANPKLFAHNVRNVMAKALGVPVSDYTYDDCKMMTRAKQMNMPNAADVVEVEKLRRKIGLDKTNIEEQVIKAALVNNANCYVTLAEFSLRLQIPAQSLATKQLFSLFDKNESGRIDFRNYLLCALFIIYTDVPLIQMIHMVALMYETIEAPGRLTRDSLYNVTRCTLAWSRDECDTIFSEIDANDRRTISFNDFRKYLQSRTDYAFVFDTPQLTADKIKPKTH